MSILDISIIVIAACAVIYTVVSVIGELAFLRHISKDRNNWWDDS